MVPTSGKQAGRLSAMGRSHQLATEQRAAVESALPTFNAEILLQYAVNSRFGPKAGSMRFKNFRVL